MENAKKVVLGSSKCDKCKDINLLLILVFLVTGILLVLFIKLLDLTVANGLLHGLIFYCNVVWINKDVLFHFDHHKGTEFLQVFLAWFNLDFGIEVCFFNGLDAYVFTWLQFLFPVYIWCISIMLIFIAKRVNILGNNGVPVLLTLFLLSYSKILTTIVSALEYTIVHVIVPQNVTTKPPYQVWAADGNLRYLEEKHIPLFIVALLVLIFIVTPYTLFLLFSRHLYKITHHRVSRWVNKLKPVIDAHSGPFEDKKEYWIGVMLLVRVLLIITPLLYGTYTELKNLGLIIILSAVLLCKSHIGAVYKNKFLSLIEDFLIYNAIALASICIIPDIVLFSTSISEAEFSESELLHVSELLTYILVGIALIKFLFITMIQILTVTKIKNKITDRCVRKERKVEDIPYCIDDADLFRERTRLIENRNLKESIH